MKTATEGEPLVAPLLLLTVLTGIVDAVSYLGLGHVFVANMTGNVVFLAFAAVGSAGFSPWPSVIATAAFLVGALVGGRIGRAARHKARLLRTMSVLNCCVAIVTFALAYVASAKGWYIGLVTALLAVAMGAQNATARRLALADLTTTVLTLTLTGVAADAGLAGGRNTRIGRRLGSVACMFLGALVGAALFATHGMSTVLAAVVTIDLAVVILAARHVNADAPWVTLA